METVSEMYKNFPSWFSANTNPSSDCKERKKEKSEMLHTVKYIQTDKTLTVINNAFSLQTLTH